MRLLSKVRVPLDRKDVVTLKRHVFLSVQPSTLGEHVHTGYHSVSDSLLYPG